MANRDETTRREHAKWEAFRLVKEDKKVELEQLLQGFPLSDWETWRNFSGRTLYQSTEYYGNRSRSGLENTECRRLLEHLLKNANRQPHERAKADVMKRVVPVHTVIPANDIDVPINEKHFHKTITHVPNVELVEKEEEMIVKQTTYEDVVDEIAQPMVDLHEVQQKRVIERAKIVNIGPRDCDKEEITQMQWMPPPVMEHIVEVPIVQIRPPHERFVRGEPEIVKTEEEIIVPHVVEVPTTKVIKKEEHISRPKSVIVHPVIVDVKYKPCELFEEKPVYVEHKVKEKHINYKPVYEMETEWCKPDESPLDKRGGPMRDLEVLRLSIPNAVKENERLKEEIEKTKERIKRSTQDLDRERRQKTVLQEALAREIQAPNLPSVTKLSKIPVQSNGYITPRTRDNSPPAGSPSTTFISTIAPSPWSPSYS